MLCCCIVFVIAVIVLQTPLTVCFPDYVGDGTADHAMDFIRDQFEAHARENGVDNLNSYFVNSLDAHNTGPVLNAIKAAILHEAVNKNETED